MANDIAVDQRNRHSLVRAEIAGLSVAYERAGNGPALVLLHGFSHGSRARRPQLEGLQDKFSVLAWDAPGAGQSSDPPDTLISLK